MRKRINVARVNGKADLSRPVLVRNVMDMLEENENLGNLSFCDAQEVCEKATKNELLRILADMITADEVIAILNR